MPNSNRSKRDPNCPAVHYPLNLLIPPKDTPLADPSLWHNTIEAYDYCKSATSLLAYVPELTTSCLVVMPCRRWSCPHCARRKTSQLANWTAAAAPNRLMTLTCDPSLYASPREAFDKTRRQLPELVKILRKRFSTLEYLRVTELTTKGFPHYHMLVRSPYLPHVVVKNAWEKLTAAKIVDVRQVDKRFSAYWYLLKYLTKLHRIEWTERHVSYSKDFFPPEVKEKTSNMTFVQRQRLDEHPHDYLRCHFPAQQVTKISSTIYLLPADFRPPNNAGEPMPDKQQQSFVPDSHKQDYS